MSRITNMQEAQERYAESSMVLPLEGLENLIDREEMIYEHGRVTKKPLTMPKSKTENLTHFFKTIPTVLRLSEWVMKKSDKKDDELLICCDTLLYASSEIEKNIESFIHNFKDKKDYINRFNNLKEVIGETLDTLSYKIEDNLKLIKSISESYDRLDNIIGILNHVDKSDAAFDMIASLYNLSQRDLQNPLLKNLIKSLDNFQESSKFKYSLYLDEDHKFQVKRMQGLSNDAYMITEENHKEGIYKLHVLSSSKIMHSEEYNNPQDLEEISRRRIIQFYNNPAMEIYFTEHANIMDQLPDKGERTRVGLAKKYTLKNRETMYSSDKKEEKKRETVHSFDALNKPITGFRNGSPESVRVYDDGKGHLLQYIKSTLMH